MQRGDTITGALLAALGCGLVAGGAAFPEDVGELPGAGFFPQVIGMLMAVLAITLLSRGLRERSEHSSPAGQLRDVAVTASLMLGYLLLWNTGWFVVRTAVFLTITLRFLGPHWIPALSYGSALAVFVYLAFDTCLNVTLD